MGILREFHGRCDVDTDANGNYKIDQVIAGTYTLTVSGSYFWSPDRRVINLPPDATAQNFVGMRIVKHSALDQQTPVPFGTLITYTLQLISPSAANLSVMDAIPTYTTYVSGSLISTLPGAINDAAANAISGTLNLSAGQIATVTFTAQVAVTPTETFRPSITNRACVRAEGASSAQCEWSNSVIHYTRPSFIYLPLIRR